jgi:hypothetical protein
MDIKHLYRKARARFLDLMDRIAKAQQNNTVCKG